jgi:demethylmenaquinone methyltransferase/2-methoxy-6-polyprenyl-1,4-benzoquinol methylase
VRAELERGPVGRNAQATADGERDVAGDPLPVPVSNDRVRATYDRVPGLYERLLGPVEAASQRRGLALLAAETDLAGARVAEVGCGPGARLGDLRDRVGPEGTVLGVDAAPGMVARARALGRGPVALGDARRLPLRTGSLDAVCVLDVLDLFGTADVAAVLGEVRRVLAPGGRLCVVTMTTADTPRSRFLRTYEWAYEHVPGAGVVGCRPVALGAALDEAGFAADRHERLVRAGVWPVRAVVASVEERGDETGDGRE